MANYIATVRHSTPHSKKIDKRIKKHKVSAPCALEAEAMIKKELKCNCELLDIEREYSLQDDIYA